MKLLIDADSIIFKTGFAVEHKNYKLYLKGEEHYGPFETHDRKRDIPKDYLSDPEVSIVVENDIEPLENCLYLVRNMLDTIVQNTNASSYRVYIKGKGNFRNAISKTRVYKGNRDVLHRPRYEQEIRDYLKTKWGAEEVDGMEVDDKVCMEQWAAHPQGFRKQDKISMIASADKDLKQVPGWHYDYHAHRTFWVNEHEAERAFYEQLLSGDSSDNIQGIEGVGHKRASKILQPCKTSREMLEAVQQAYKDSCGSRGIEVMTEMAQLLYLKRSPEDMWRLPDENPETP